MIDAKEARIIISLEEYEALREDSDLLECLMGCGVDNWEGYSEAIQLMEDNKNND